MVWAVSGVIIPPTLLDKVLWLNLHNSSIRSYTPYFFNFWIGYSKISKRPVSFYMKFSENPDAVR